MSSNQHITSWSVLLVAILTSFSVQSQVVNEGLAISQNNGVVVSIQGMDVQNDGNWTNEGVLNVYGSWTGAGTLTSGQLSLLGENQELVGVTSVDDLFVMGGGNKSVGQNLDIVQSLELLEGNVVLENGATLTMLEGSELVGGNATSFVEGTLSLYGTGDMNFPLGFSGEYRPVNLIGVGEGSEPVTLSTGMTTLGIGTTLTEIDESRSWDLSTGRNIEALVLPVLEPEYVDNITDVVVAFSEGVDPFEAVLGAQYDGSKEIATFTPSQNLTTGTYALGRLNNNAGPPIMVVNVVTANNDGKHDYLRIDNIDFYDGNQVEIYNRAGQKVFEMTDYNNHDRVFDGRGNVGGNTDLLLTGSYFYSIKLGRKNVETGFIYVKTQ